MARRRARTVNFPTTFVGTFYDVEAGVYAATRKDGTITIGQINKPGVNIETGRVVIDADSYAHTER